MEARKNQELQREQIGKSSISALPKQYNNFLTDSYQT
jgi:hypothetical protein